MKEQKTKINKKSYFSDEIAFLFILIFKLTHYVNCAKIK